MAQTPDLAALDSFLVALNRASGEVILPLFRVENGLEDKGPPGALSRRVAFQLGPDWSYR